MRDTSWGIKSSDFRRGKIATKIGGNRMAAWTKALLCGVGAVAMAGALSLMAPQEARALNCSTALNANNFVGALNGQNNGTQVLPFPANCTGNNVLGNGNLSNNAPATAGSVQNNNIVGNGNGNFNGTNFQNNNITGNGNANGNGNDFSNNAIIGNGSGNANGNGFSSNQIFGNTSGNGNGANSQNNTIIGDGSGNANWQAPSATT